MIVQHKHLSLKGAKQEHLATAKKLFNSEHLLKLLITSLLTNMKITLDDFDGLIGIANTSRYETFVDNDWQMEDLIQRFIDETNKNNLLIWMSNEDGGNLWNIVVNEKVNKKPYRSFTGYITVTEGKLHFITYQDLSYVAQFQDEVLPSDENKENYVKLENGTYIVTISQLFNPKMTIGEQGEIHFAIHFEKLNLLKQNSINEIPWVSSQ